MKPFRDIRGVSPRKTAFDLSHDVKLTGDMGKLYPVMVQSTIPGDRFSINQEVVVRLQPLIAPVLHDVDVVLHTFFVPNRILWDGWEEFITGGKDGDSAQVLPRVDLGTPEWANANESGKLWDYFGLPLWVDPVGAYPIDMPFRAYNRIWNDYYRDSNLQNEVSYNNRLVLRRNWQKDYFTSALLGQQRGVAPSLPLSGLAPVSLDSSHMGPAAGTAVGSSGVPWGVADAGQFSSWFDSLSPVADLTGAGTFTQKDLRELAQTQLFQELINRGGYRYTEFIETFWGVKNPDERLQRPEYVGGLKGRVIFSEVLQTSNNADDNTPQGNLAGHGLAVQNQNIGSYYAPEYGVIMTLMSIMPKPAYQQGINKQWLYTHRFDFANPAFVHLSEEAIIGAEIFAQGNSVDNNKVFGYQAKYDELRYIPSYVAGNMRSNSSLPMDYWHLANYYAAPPALNSAFIECNPSKRIFADPSQDGFIISVGNRITALRPLPVIGEPGLLDHMGGN